MPQQIEVPGQGIVEFPDGMTDAQIVSAIQKLSRSRAMENYDPTESMSTTQKALAGVGKAFVDTGRGVGQMLGMVSREDVAKAREQDKALINTTAGKIGNFAGDVVTTLPLMAVPGANTIKGASLLGAAYGLTRPSESTKETLSNVALGGGGGAVGQIAGQLIGKGINAAKAAAEPLTKEGQNAILGRLLQKTAGGGQFADDAALALQNAKAPVAGFEMTAGQAANNPGIAALERTATAMQPEAAAALGQRFTNQNEALANALGGIADTSKREFFDASRQTAADSLYKQAFAQAPVDSPWIKGQFTQLMKRPAFQDALKEAQTLAANQGLKLDPKNQTQIAHYTKMALDDQIKNATGNAQRALIETRNKLLTVIESDKFAPAYGEARKTFQAMSQPVNEIDTALAIQKAATRPLDGTIQPAAFARALSDKTAQSATGFRGATLDKVMSPDSMQTLEGIKRALQASDFAKNAGRGPGSDTLQKLAYSNMIDAAGVPTFLRGMGAGQMVGNLASRGADAVYGRANKEMSQKLAEAMLNPQDVAKLMQMKQLPFNDYQKLAAILGYAGATAPVALTQAAQQ